MDKIDITLKADYNDCYDVIVAGGGAAGCAAAAAAAREGVKTLLVEKSGFLGGMTTGGMVPEFCPYTDGEKIIHNGIAKRVLFEMKKETREPADKFDYCAIDAERMKLILDKLVTDAGADILFYTSVCGVCKDDERNIKSVYLANKSGIHVYSARVYVDCTGDADVAAFAGCDYVVGDEDGNTQMPTLCFDMCNVNDDSEKARETIYNIPRETIHDIIADDEFPLIDNRFFCQMKIGKNFFGYNAGHVRGVDGLDMMSISKGLVSGRRKAFEYRDALRKHLPEIFENAHITATAPFLGIRETRRIKGDYVITVEDYLMRKSFDDEIGRNCYHIDVHDSKTFYSDGGGKKKRERYKAGESHGIPYRALVPEKLDNLLVAGRAVSCERQVQGSIRIIPVCFVTGEAAGIAASLMVKNAVTSHDVDIKALKDILDKNK